MTPVSRDHQRGGYAPSVPNINNLSKGYLNDNNVQSVNTLCKFKYKKYIHFVTPEIWTLIESVLVSVSFDSVNKQGQERIA